AHGRAASGAGRARRRPRGGHRAAQDLRRAGPAGRSRAAVRMRLADEAATARLGEAVAAKLGAGEAVCLSGPLGAGKSTLARALIRALTTPDEEVPSPTFTLVQFYEGPRLSVAHF